jgi:hypothetical protein
MVRDYKYTEGSSTFLSGDIMRGSPPDDQTRVLHHELSHLVPLHQKK